VIAAACIALAACTSSSGSAASPAGQHTGTPVSGGTVTVKQGDKVICVMKVVNGKGTCVVPARNFGIGGSQIYGTYSGGGRSQPITMTITPGTTASALTITPAKVAYANEQAAHLSVKVTAVHGGTPTGTVSVTSGATTVCLITLAAAKGGGAQGSCALPAKKLPAGSQPLVASYPGDHWYRPSAARATLTVSK
jgi:hypothetical protein